MKEQLASREMTLESLTENDDTVRYFTGLSSYLKLAALFAFLSPHVPTLTRWALSLFQSFMHYIYNVPLNTPLQHLVLY